MKSDELQPPRAALMPIEVECPCGVVLKLANGWTVWRCGHCGRVDSWGETMRGRNENSAA